MDPPDRDLILEDSSAGVFRVHRAAFTSEEVFRREQDLIFDRAWLYVGHTSEVPTPGSFVRRTIAGRPVVLVRTRDGDIRVLLNSCTHRGAVVCRQESGSARAFQCFYHGWTFSLNGDLVGVPDEGGYSDAFCRDDLGLRSPAQVAVYRDFVFATFNSGSSDLPTYLGGAGEWLDMIADQSAAGMQVVGGTNKYAIHANWKLLIENSVDGYHFGPVHVTYRDYLGSVHQSHARRGAGWGHDLGNGHAAMENEAASWSRAKPHLIERRSEFEHQFGVDYATRMIDHLRNLVIFPNLVVNDAGTITVRVIAPVRPDYMEITAWALVASDAGPTAIAASLDTFEAFLGPGGFGTPDDVEALESCQRGFATVKELEYSDVSRGMARDASASDERQMRAFWRAWHSRLLGEEDEGQPIVLPPRDPARAGSGGA